AIALGGSNAAAVPLIANLPTGNPITDGRALLRYALPIDNPDVRKLQGAIEETSDTLRISRKKISAIKGNLTQADRIVSVRANDLLKSVPDDRKAEGEQLIEQIKSELAEMRAGVEANDREAVWQERGHVLSAIGLLEELMVDEFPFEVPAEYGNLPQLEGRATIEFETDKGTITAVVDGYSAPVTAGNFVDLVQRGFYDGLEFTRAEESYVLQIGDPPGKEVGFIDPESGKYRSVPLEVLVKGDKEPTYGITLEDAGRYLDQPVLPFSAYGALAMARPGDDVNGGSSQFFFFLFEPELTPAGANLLDGRYAIFGYVTEGKEVLEKLKEGDKITVARVVDGLDKLVEPQAA
ncbi:MAG: peptidylprolyl isomerase, partial [Leptolyngbyaceae cyanobacterium SM1_3_5]|nr:peptidylprolyl isomerase [Leptolyngbyaceae cyanobacterium SM1_3_5]